MRNIQNLPKFLSFGNIPKDFFRNIKRMLLIHSNSSLDKEFLLKNKDALSGIKIIKINISKLKNTTDIMDFDVKKFKINFDMVLAVGGGNVIDVSKIIYTKLIYKNWKKALSNNDYCRSNHKKKLAVVSTLPGSGAEASKVAVLNQKNNKIILTSADFIPQYIFYDLNKIIKNKPEQLVLRLIDSIVHSLESESSILRNDFSTIYAKNVIKNGEKLLKKYLENSDIFLDIRNIKQLCLISLYGGISQSEAGSGLCHALAHTFEKEFNYSHSESILLCSFISLEYQKKYKNINDINNLKQIFQKIYNRLFNNAKKIRHNKILSSLNIQRFIAMAKKDVCWKIEKNKIHESELFKIINKKVKKNKWNS